MITKQDILDKLKLLKDRYLDEGVEIYALFGSYATEKQDNFSDIDLAYKINHEIFSKKYKDGFSKLLRLQNIKEELESFFGKNIDFVPYKESFKECEYV